MNYPRKPTNRGGGRPGPPRRPSGRPQRVHTADEPRSLVYSALADHFRRYPDLRIDALDTSRLQPLDAAFAHAIHDAALRHWLTLVYLIELGFRRPFRQVEPRAAGALLGGAAQIVYLDRVPVHAAVNESVNWAKRASGLGASKLVNAVLRRISEMVLPENREYRESWNDSKDAVPLSDGRALVLHDAYLPDDPIERLSSATSHPKRLIRAWIRDYSLREARMLALHGLVHPPTILNSLHATGPLPESCAPHNVPGHCVWTESRDSLAQLLTQRQDIWVQDPASSSAALAVADRQPKVVVDVCAGKGTKTRQLAAMFPNAQIVATDIDLIRRRELERTFRGHDRVKIVAFDRLVDWAGKADLVLTDVPCSNTGVLARRVEARYRFHDDRVAELLQMQRQIVADAVRLTRGGQRDGIIVYSTCSLDPRENRGVTEWASRWHSFKIPLERQMSPNSVPGEAATAYHDGSYVAILE